MSDEECWPIPSEGNANAFHVLADNDENLTDLTDFIQRMIQVDDEHQPSTIAFYDTHRHLSDNVWVLL